MDAETVERQNLHYRSSTFVLRYFPSDGGSVSMSGPFSVIATVCSKWALRLPSAVRNTSQSAPALLIASSVPMLIIGSIQIVIPGFNLMPEPRIP